MKTPNAIQKRLVELRAEYERLDAENQKDRETIERCRLAIKQRETAETAWRIEVTALEFAIEAFSPPIEVAPPVRQPRSAQRVLQALRSLGRPETARFITDYLEDMPIATVSSQLTQLAQRGLIVHQGTQWGLANG